MVLLIVLAVALGGRANGANGGVTFPDVKFCATLAESAIPLGMTTTARFFIWNRSDKPIEYAITPVELYLRYRDVNAPVPDHLPPQFKTLEPGELKLGGGTIPDDRVFRSDVAGEYELPLELQLKSDGQTETRAIVLKLHLMDESPPSRYEVKPVLARDTKDSGTKIPAYKLDDSAWKDNCSRVRERIFQGATQENVEDWLSRERQYYDTACGHDRFGSRDDWGTGGLIHVFETLVHGDYLMNELSYREIYEVQYEAAKKWGLLPSFAIAHAIPIFREQGKDAALKYLDGLDTAGWNCVDLAIRGWARERIASWKGKGKPEGLVYTKELRKKLIFDKETHRLRLPR